MLRRLAAFASISTLSLVLTASALAHPGPPHRHVPSRPAPVRPMIAPGHDHDSGFLARLSLGFGYTTASVANAEEVTWSGFGGMGSIALGGVVTPNLAINADLFGMSMFEPTVEVNGREVTDLDNTTASVGCLGVGATYYLMPANVYFALSAGMAIATVEYDDGFFRFEDESDVGFGVNVMIAKEWWVARHWGIGIAAQLVYASVPPDAGGDNINALGIGVLFTATYN